MAENNNFASRMLNRIGAQVSSLTIKLAQAETLLEDVQAENADLKKQLAAYTKEADPDGSDTTASTDADAEPVQE